jgi:hypothetical protein
VLPFSRRQTFLNISCSAKQTGPRVTVIYPQFTVNRRITERDVPRKNDENNEVEEIFRKKDEENKNKVRLSLQFKFSCCIHLTFVLFSQNRNEPFPAIAEMLDAYVHFYYYVLFLFSFCCVRVCVFLC